MDPWKPPPNLKHATRILHDRRIPSKLRFNFQKCMWWENSWRLFHVSPKLLNLCARAVSPPFLVDKVYSNTGWSGSTMASTSAAECFPIFLTSCRASFLSLVLISTGPGYAITSLSEWSAYSLPTVLRFPDWSDSLETLFSSGSPFPHGSLLICLPIFSEDG